MAVNEPWALELACKGICGLLTQCKLTVTLDLTKWWMITFTIDFCGFIGPKGVFTVIETRSLQLLYKRSEFLQLIIYKNRPTFAAHACGLFS